MKCFVIMPFGDPEKDEEFVRKYEAIYSYIQSAVESIRINDKENGFITCHKANREPRPGEIMADVINNLVTSEIVIADLTGGNPNVFYELGVRHAVKSNTVLIAEYSEDIPFDLKGLRIIFYQFDRFKIAKFQKSLQKTVKKLFSEPEQIDNPVRRFLNDRETERMSRSKTPSDDAEKSILSVKNHLKKEFDYQLAEQKKEFDYKLAERNKKIDQIMEWITSPQKDDAKIAEIRKSGESNEIDLEFFEGNWDNMMTGSRYYAKIVKGKPLVPYCYSERTEITGHFYNCRLVEKTLFARFEWFDEAVSGYAFFRVESENRLVGGWWYSEDLTSETVNDISDINDSIPGMNEITLDRDTTSKEMPEWAKEYFEELEPGNKD